jgi:hypothetical protein
MDIPLQPGSVCDCEVAFTDTVGSKVRPVVVLGGPHPYMRLPGGIYIICPVTSTEVFKGCPTLSALDFEEGGLRKPLSYLNVLKPAGIGRTQIKSFRGRIKPVKLAILRAEIAKRIGLG